MKQMKGLIGVLILSAATLSGCHTGSSASITGACGGTCFLTSVTYGAGVFVVVGTGGKQRPPTKGSDGGADPWVEVSTDGINWKSEDIQYTPAQLAQASELQSVTYGDAGFVTTDGVHVLHSADGLNWAIESFESTSNKISYVIYDGTRYILYSNTTGQFGDREEKIDNFPWKVSTDGVNWTDYGTITVTNGPAGEPVSIIHVAGMYEAAWQPAENVPLSTRYLTATSTDGLSWTLGTPMAVSTHLGVYSVYDIVHTGDRYLVFGGTDLITSDTSSWGVALYGSSVSAMTAVGRLEPPGQQFFFPAGEPLQGNPYETHGLVSNGMVTVALGIPGLFVTTDGVTWSYQGLDDVVPLTECQGEDQPASCTGFASGAAAPGGSIVVLVTDGTGGAETMDGIHWVKSNL